MKKNLLYLFMIGLTFMFTACPDEEAVTPMAYFEVSSNTVQVDQSISFDNLSDDAESYGWNFGDGNISTEISPVHSYDEADNYTVTLIAYNKSKSDEFTSVITVLANETTLKACFTISNSSPLVFDDVTFNSSCSEGADSFSWDFGDGNTSTEAIPVHDYANTGTYTVTLTAYSGSNSDQTTKSLTVRDENTETFDPYNYNSAPSGGWGDHYFADFSDPSSTDWTQETNSDYSSIIENDTYTIENFNYESGWFFWTNSAEMPDESTDFDIDVYYQIIYDDSTYGDGTFWGLDNTDGLDYYYYRYTHFQSEVWYIYGDSEFGSWISDGWGQGGYYEEYNLLSIRKYQNKYYLFMNEMFIGEHDFEGFYGSNFGFYIGKRSKMQISGYGISKMIFSSKKSASQKTNVPTPSNGKGSGVMKIDNLQRLK